MIRFSWILLCHRYNPAVYETPPRFILHSPSLVTLYINTFKSDGLCLKEVNCPKLVSIFTYGSESEWIELDGPINTAPGFQIEHVSHEDNHLTMPHKFYRRQYSRRYNNARGPVSFDLTLPDLSLTLIDRNR